MNLSLTGSCYGSLYNLHNLGQTGSRVYLFGIVIGNGEYQSSPNDLDNPLVEGVITDYEFDYNENKINLKARFRGGVENIDSFDITEIGVMGYNDYDNEYLLCFYHWFDDTMRIRFENDENFILNIECELSGLTSDGILFMEVVTGPTSHVGFVSHNSMNPVVILEEHTFRSNWDEVNKTAPIGTSEVEIWFDYNPKYCIPVNIKRKSYNGPTYKTYSFYKVGLHVPQKCDKLTLSVDQTKYNIGDKIKISHWLIDSYGGFSNEITDYITVTENKTPSITLQLKKIEDNTEDKDQLLLWDSGDNYISISFSSRNDTVNILGPAMKTRRHYMLIVSYANPESEIENVDIDITGSQYIDVLDKVVYDDRVEFKLFTQNVMFDHDTTIYLKITDSYNENHININTTIENTWSVTTFSVAGGNSNVNSYGSYDAQYVEHNRTYLVANWRGIACLNEDLSWPPIWCYGVKPKDDNGNSLVYNPSIVGIYKISDTIYAILDTSDYYRALFVYFIDVSDGNFNVISTYFHRISSVTWGSTKFNARLAFDLENHKMFAYGNLEMPNAQDSRQREIFVARYSLSSDNTQVIGVDKFIRNHPAIWDNSNLTDDDYNLYSIAFHFPSTFQHDGVIYNGKLYFATGFRYFLEKDGHYYHKYAQIYVVDCNTMSITRYYIDANRANNPPNYSFNVGKDMFVRNGKLWLHNNSGYVKTNDGYLSKATNNFVILDPDTMHIDEAWRISGWSYGHPTKANYFPEIDTIFITNYLGNPVYQSDPNFQVVDPVTRKSHNYDVVQGAYSKPIFGGTYNPNLKEFVAGYTHACRYTDDSNNQRYTDGFGVASMPLTTQFVDSHPSDYYYKDCWFEGKSLYDYPDRINDQVGIKIWFEEGSVPDISTGFVVFGESDVIEDDGFMEVEHTDHIEYFDKYEVVSTPIGDPIGQNRKIWRL